MVRSCPVGISEKHISDWGKSPSSQLFKSNATKRSFHGNTDARGCWREYCRFSMRGKTAFFLLEEGSLVVPTSSVYNLDLCCHFTPGSIAGIGSLGLLRRPRSIYSLLCLFLFVKCPWVPWKALYTLNVLLLLLLLLFLLLVGLFIYLFIY